MSNGAGVGSGHGQARDHAPRWEAHGTENRGEASRGDAEDAEKARETSAISASPRDPSPGFHLRLSAAGAVLRQGDTQGLATTSRTIFAMTSGSTGLARWRAKPLARMRSRSSARA